MVYECCVSFSNVDSYTFRQTFYPDKGTVSRDFLPILFLHLLGQQMSFDNGCTLYS